MPAAPPSSAHLEPVTLGLVVEPFFMSFEDETRASWDGMCLTFRGVGYEWI
jgi:hypothetical protein